LQVINTVTFVIYTDGPITKHTHSAFYILQTPKQTKHSFYTTYLYAHDILLWAFYITFCNLCPSKQNNALWSQRQKRTKWYVLLVYCDSSIVAGKTRFRIINANRTLNHSERVPCQTWTRIRHTWESASSFSETGHRFSTKFGIRSMCPPIREGDRIYAISTSNSAQITLIKL
jgi:hypothetical protein